MNPGAVRQISSGSIIGIYPPPPKPHFMFCSRGAEFVVGEGLGELKILFEKIPRNGENVNQEREKKTNVLVYRIMYRSPRQYIFKIPSSADRSNGSRRASKSPLPPSIYAYKHKN